MMPKSKTGDAKQAAFEAPLNRQFTRLGAREVPIEAVEPIAWLLGLVYRPSRPFAFAMTVSGSARKASRQPVQQT